MLLPGVPVGPPGPPIGPSPQRPHGATGFSLRIAVVAVLLVLAPSILVLVTHALTVLWERLATRAARHVHTVWFADAIARGDFTEAELQADRFFDPARKAGSS